MHYGGYKIALVLTNHENQGKIITPFMIFQSPGRYVTPWIVAPHLLYTAQNFLITPIWVAMANGNRFLVFSFAYFILYANGVSSSVSLFSNCRWAFFITFGGFFMAHFSRKCYSTVKQQLQTTAGFSSLVLSEMDTVFMATYAAGNIINGKLGDTLNPSTAPCHWPLRQWCLPLPHQCRSLVRLCRF